MDARQPLQPGEDSRRNWRRINAVDADVKVIGQLVGLANGDITSRSRFPIRPGEVEIIVCDPATGEEKTYVLMGREKPVEA